MQDMLESTKSIRMETLLQLDLGQKLGQLRAIPVKIGGNDRVFLAGIAHILTWIRP